MNRLSQEIVVVLDCEYSTMNMPGTGRPDTFKDQIELCQIGAIKVQFPSGTVLEEFDELITPTDINPDNSDFGWFEDFTGLTYERIQNEGSDLNDVIKKFREFVEDYPIILMMGDHQVIENDTQRRLGCGWQIKRTHDVSILKPYLPWLFRSMGIELSDENLKLTSGQLYTLVDKEMDIRTHNALDDVKSMIIFLVEYFSKTQN